MCLHIFAQILHIACNSCVHYSSSCSHCFYCAVQVSTKFNFCVHYTIGLALFPKSTCPYEYRFTSLPLVMYNQSHENDTSLGCLPCGLLALWTACPVGCKIEQCTPPSDFLLLSLNCLVGHLSDPGAVFWRRIPTFLNFLILL